MGCTHGCFASHPCSRLVSLAFFFFFFCPTMLDVNSLPEFVFPSLLVSISSLSLFFSSCELFVHISRPFFNGVFSVCLVDLSEFCLNAELGDVYCNCLFPCWLVFSLSLSYLLRYKRFRLEYKMYIGLFVYAFLAF